MESKKSVVEINFGMSAYVRNAPRVPLKEMIVTIPIEGRVPKVKDKDHPSTDLIPEEAVGKMVEKGLLSFPVEKIWHTEMLIYWIPERKEWIGILHSSWLESDAWGEDESYRGPYALDDYYAKRILGVLGIPQWRLSLKVPAIQLDQILQMSPNELEKFKEEFSPGVRK